MRLFRRQSSIRLNPQVPETYQRLKEDMPNDMTLRCPACGQLLLKEQVDPNYTCPACDCHLFFPSEERMTWLCDTESFQAWDQDLKAADPLDFPNYRQRQEEIHQVHDLDSAILTGQGKLMQQTCALGVMDQRYLMASMGTVVGEKLTRLFERATDQGLPVILYIASGGARMQEGILSLMQMAKVTQAVNRHHEAGLFYLAVLTHPTTGGVTASFANQADVIIAEPQATIGFAGRRVIEQTLKVTLDDDFQTAESVLAQGFIDQIIPRSRQRQTLGSLLTMHNPTPCVRKEGLDESL